MKNRITPGQALRIGAMTADALCVAKNISAEAAQKVIGGKSYLFPNWFTKAFYEFANINPEENRRFPSRVDYHYKPMTCSHQIERLAKLYPDLDSSFVDGLSKKWPGLPKEAELLQVVPKISAVARDYKLLDPYGEGLQVISQRMNNYLISDLNIEPKSFPLTDLTRQILERIEPQTPGDFIIFPMHSGRPYRGFSRENARWEIEHSPSQWSLPSWVVGHFLICHPDRVAEGSLNIDCLGDRRGDPEHVAEMWSSYHLSALPKCRLGISDNMREPEESVPDEQYGAAAGWLLA